MCEINKLLENNKEYRERKTQQDPDYFKRLSLQQNPDYLWIGCSDSRVPANEIVDLAPGELFVHRNIANIVQPNDFNCMSVVQYAVEVLKVKHIIVVGHYGCGGVRAALSNDEHGLVDNWISPIKNTFTKYKEEIAQLEDKDMRVNRMVELNVIEQVSNVAKVKDVQLAWQRGQSLSIHGWVYSLRNGKIKDLGVTVNGTGNLEDIFKLKETTHGARPEIRRTEQD